MKQKNIYILLFILFVFLLVFIIFMNKQNIRENLFNFSDLYKVPEVSPNQLQNSIREIENNSPPCKGELRYYPRLLPDSVQYLDTNIVIQTKMELRKLFDLLSTAKNKQRRIQKITKTEYYIPPTTDFLLQKQLHLFTNMILDIIRQYSDFDFQYFNYDRILIITGEEDEKNYIYDVLVQENNKVFQLKLRIDVCVRLDHELKNNILTCAKETTPEFPTYPIGIPSEDQLIPLPTEVSITSKQVYSANGVNVLMPREVKELFINQVSIFNSDLVVDPQLPTKNLGGTTDGSLENKKIELPGYTPIQAEGKIYNRWVTLPDQPSWLRAYPCAPPAKNWDDLGVYQPDVKGEFPCVGVRSSAWPEPVQPNYYPTLATLPRNVGENAWLFDLATGIPSFPTGHATGGR
jgi:hypothetical protein